MEITIATLIYKSPAYLDFVMNSLFANRSKHHDEHYLIVCNDATPEVVEHAMRKYAFRSDFKCQVVDFRNADPNEYWIQRVYNAWNACLNNCETPYICFVNSDMAFSPGWLDNLAKHDLTKVVPTSRLVESERMPSLPGLIGKNFGQTIGSFNEAAFLKFADEIRTDGIAPQVGAYMPSLFSTELLKKAGGWRKNYIYPNGHQIPGDQITFAILQKHFGLVNVMCCDSIVYHLQRGESSEVGDA